MHTTVKDNHTASLTSIVLLLASLSLVSLPTSSTYDFQISAIPMLLSTHHRVR
jgi:hypothetical protein